MDTIRLLKKSPDVALILMANEIHGLSLTPGNSRVVSVEAVDGKDSIATIEAYYNGADQANDQSIADPFKGRLRFPFKRIDLAEFFGDTIDVPLCNPTNTSSVVEVLSTKSLIVFDSNDFELQRLEGSVVTLHAKAESRRWVGSLTLRLSE